jgi:hypothetical protein
MRLSIHSKSRGEHKLPLVRSGWREAVSHPREEQLYLEGG